MNQLSKIKWIKSGSSLIIVHEGNSIHINRGTVKFKRALQLVQAGKEEELLTYIFPQKKIEKFTKGDFSLTDQGQITETKTNKVIPNVISKRLLEFAQNDYSYTALKKFLDNLQKNPNKDSVEQLYHFLEACNAPITSDGCFLAYKYVTEVSSGKLVDSHTKTFSNNPGQIVAMDRSKCDSNRSVTCSRGLHVAAYSYARECGSGQVIIEVKVNPKDVVAVPDDYQNRKMRVCRYEVLRKGSSEVEKSYLSQQFVAKASQAAQKIKTDLPYDFVNMTAAQIIDLVKKEVGHVITIATKNKKSIIKKATELLSSVMRRSNAEGGKIALTGMTAQQIIDKVKEQTGTVISLSLKNKKGILNKAIQILTKHGLQVEA